MKNDLTEKNDYFKNVSSSFRFSFSFFLFSFQSFDYIDECFICFGEYDTCSVVSYNPAALSCSSEILSVGFSTGSVPTMLLSPIRTLSGSGCCWILNAEKNINVEMKRINSIENNY